MKLIAAQDINLGDLLADSPTNKLLAATGRIEWNLFEEGTQIYKTIKSLGKLKQDQFDEKFLNLLYFILSILAHFHNLEDSLLKPELLILPRTMNYPAYTLTEYEIQLVKTDGLNGEVLGLRQSIKKSFEGFQKIMHSSFTKKQINILLMDIKLQSRISSMPILSFSFFHLRINGLLRDLLIVLRII
eukprot:TRINITY_DN478_c0_g1_i1.p1 TRINITY_DN478_c0_g1~~TRINITY_DN478_c0_g1_i1.p1  ORF type:complete len:187 (-),score=21.43 TRINITY_DN478_c0_g1_i1:907-1467(-)